MEVDEAQARWVGEAQDDAREADGAEGGRLARKRRLRSRAPARRGQRQRRADAERRGDGGAADEA